jgi:hypothetical protein
MLITLSEIGNEWEKIEPFLIPLLRASKVLFTNRHKWQNLCLPFLLHYNENKSKFIG